jgi:6-phosphogluconolactonase
LVKLAELLNFVNVSMSKILACAAAALTLSFTQVSAAPAATAAAPATYVYVSNSVSNDVSVFRLDPRSGALAPLQTVPVGGAAMPIALSAANRRLYVGVRSVPYRIAGFAIDADSGKLRELGTAPLSASMAYLSLDRSERYLLSASYGGNRFSVNPVSALGVAGATLQDVATGPMSHSVLASPDNRYVFGAVLGSDVWMRYKFDAASGALTEPQAALTLPPQSGPRFFVWSPDQRFVYLVDELDGKLHVLAFDGAANSVRLVQTVNVLPDGFTGKPWASDVHLSPDGGLLYASERRSSTLAGFRVDRATGLLSKIGNWPTEAQPRGFNIASSGRFLLAAGELSGHVSVYRIGADGQLGALGRYRAGDGPNWIALADFPAAVPVKAAPVRAGKPRRH